MNILTLDLDMNHEFFQQLKKDLDIPAELLTSAFRYPGTMRGEEWRHFDVLLFGVPCGDIPDPSPFPYVRIRLGDEPDQLGTIPFMATQVWFMAAQYRDSPLYIEQRWHPANGYSVAIRGLENDHRRADIDRAWRGLKLIRWLNNAGRPRLEDEQWQDWRELTERIIELRRSGRFTSEEAAARSVHVPYDTFRKWKRKIR